MPLFLSDRDDPLLALFDEKGFFLAAEAKRAYDRIKSLPHLYVLRLSSNNQFYFGKSNQSGGRLKRSHAYHLGGLAHELLGTTRYDDQRTHRFWLRAWFESLTVVKLKSLYAVRMQEPIVVSFLLCDAGELLNSESALIQEARCQGKAVLNLIP